MAGVTWEITANVMRTWFDHEPKFTEKQYNAEIITKEHKRDAARAMRMMWENEIGDITKQLKTRAGAEAFQKALYNNISQGKTAKEEEAGVELIDTFEGFTSRIIQHEVDHLNGIIMIDRMHRLDRDKFLRKRRRQYKKIKKSLQVGTRRRH